MAKAKKGLKALKSTKAIKTTEASKVRGGAIKGNLGMKQKSWNPAN